MEVMSFHQITQGLRLKGRQTRITNLPVVYKKGVRHQKMEEAADYERSNITVHMQNVNLRIGFKVSIIYRLNQLFSNFYNFLFTSYNKKKEWNV